MLATRLDDEPPFVPSAPQLQRALVRLNLPKPEEPDEDEPSASAPPEPTPSHNRPLHLVMSTLLTTFGVPVIRVDRRPSLNPAPFEQVYFVELEELGSGFEEELSKHGHSSWLHRVQMGIDRVTAAGAEATIIGVW